MSKRRYFKQLRVTQFRAIIELSRCGGFAAAAKTLELSTPSVWQQVRALEDEFGIDLVEVQGQQVSLTEHGRLLVEMAEPVVTGFDAILEEFTSRVKSGAQKLAIASPANILVNELPASIQDFRDRFADVELSLIDLASNPARQALEDGRVDMAVVGLLDQALPSTLQSDSVTRFPFMLVSRRDHPVVSLKRLELRSLARFPFVMSSEGTNARRRMDEVFESSRLSNDLRIVCEASTKELILQYVQLDFGIAIVPISPRFRDQTNSPYANVAALSFRDVSRTFGHEEIVILRRALRHEPKHHQAFREVILSSVH